MTNDNFYLLTTSNSPASNGVHSVPTYAVATGTMTNTSGERNVVGVGTTFTTQVREGDWLIVSGKQARMVDSVPSDTLIWLREGFSGGSGAGVAVLVAPLSPFKKITIFPQTGATGTIDGAAFQAGVYYNFDGNPSADAKSIVVTAGSVEVRISNA